MHTAKVTAFIMILMLLILGFSWYNIRWLGISSAAFDKSIEQIEDSIKSNNWIKAKEDLTYLQNSWSKTEKTWAMLQDHFEIDNISHALSKLASYIEVKNKSLALGEAAALKQFIGHIPRKEMPKLNNIL